MLDIKEVTESIFKLDKRIRCVAIPNPKYTLLQSRMREGVSSLTSAQTDREFMRMAAPLIVDSAEKLRLFCGAMRRLTVRYDKVFLALYRTAAHLLILSLDPQVDQALLDRMLSKVWNWLYPRMRKISSSAPIPARFIWALRPSSWAGPLGADVPRVGIAL